MAWYGTKKGIDMWEKAKKQDTGTGPSIKLKSVSRERSPLPSLYSQVNMWCTRNNIDESARKVLFDQSNDIQRWVLSKGTVTTRQNPSSTLLARIRDLKKDNECPYDRNTHWLCSRCGLGNSMSDRTCKGLPGFPCDESCRTSEEYQRLNRENPDVARGSRDRTRTR